jgi:hypothetical protein
MEMVEPMSALMSRFWNGGIYSVRAGTFAIIRLVKLDRQGYAESCRLGTCNYSILQDGLTTLAMGIDDHFVHTHRRECGTAAHTRHAYL